MRWWWQSTASQYAGAIFQRLSTPSVYGFEDEEPRRAIVRLVEAVLRRRRANVIADCVGGRRLNGRRVLLGKKKHDCKEAAKMWTTYLRSL
jgi:hypothetical protein